MRTFVVEQPGLIAGTETDQAHESVSARPYVPHVAMLECDIAAGVPHVEAFDDDGVAWTRAELLGARSPS